MSVIQTHLRTGDTLTHKQTHIQIHTHTHHDKGYCDLVLTARGEMMDGSLVTIQWHGERWYVTGQKLTVSKQD